jgi:predicted alpha/beta-fold hydrolase
MPTSPSDERAFAAAWWCRNAHLQTLWPYAFRHRPRPDLVRERLELPDGDFLDLCHTTGSGGPRVLVLHGLEGSWRSHYARGLLDAVHRRGWCGTLMHFRGCSGEPNRLPRGYHSGETGDLDYVARLLRGRAPNAPLAVVGYSLGGNVLLKWLGESDAARPVDAGVAVSVPFELAKSAARIDKGFSRLYQWRLLGSMKRSVRRKFARLPAPVDLSRLNAVRNFEQFDELITAPLHGFRDAADYYARSSSRQFLSGILRPTLIIHAADDPFMTPDTVPGPSELSAQVRLELSAHGGHAGFVAGSLPWTPVYWAEQRIVRYLAEIFGESRIRD